MTGSDLLADLRSRGIDVETDGSRLRWRPDFMVNAPLTALILQHRAELIELLSEPDRLERCQTCSRPLDSARRCPKCFDRVCIDCHRLTGSYFIQRCVACGQAFQKRGPS